MISSSDGEEEFVEEEEEEEEDEDDEDEEYEEDDDDDDDDEEEEEEEEDKNKFTPTTTNFSGSVNINFFVNHKNCECVDCVVTNNSIKTLLKNIWDSYPFSKGSKLFRETLINTPPDQFEIKLYDYGAAANLICCLTGNKCIQYYTIKSNRKTTPCQNCNGMLSCIRTVEHLNNSVNDKVKFVIDSNYGKYLTEIRFLSNVDTFIQQTPKKMKTTMSLNVTRVYDLLRTQFFDPQIRSRGTKLRRI